MANGQARSDNGRGHRIGFKVTEQERGFEVGTRKGGDKPHEREGKGVLFDGYSFMASEGRPL